MIPWDIVEAAQRRRKRRWLRAVLVIERGPAGELRCWWRFA